MAVLETQGISSMALNQREMIIACSVAPRVLDCFPLETLGLDE